MVTWFFLDINLVVAAGSRAEVGKLSHCFNQCWDNALAKVNLLNNNEAAIEKSQTKVNNLLYTAPNTKIS